MNETKRNAIYPLSGDPMHYGHLYNIETAAKTGFFDRIYVAMGINSKKKYLFDTKEREELAKRTIAPLGLDNVVIESFEGLLAHYAYERNAPIIIRGARKGNDFDYEKAISDFNNQYGLQTFIIPSSNAVEGISSTMVKEIISGGGLVQEYVHPSVKQTLEEKILGVSVVGVTGNMGAGKSYYCHELAKQAAEKGIPMIHYDADKIIHALYNEGGSAHPWLYNAMKDTFGEEVCKAGKINRKALSEVVFGNEKSAEKLKEILAVPFRIEFEKALKQTKGILLFDAAYLTEYNLLGWANYNVMLVGCEESERRKRVWERDRIDTAKFDKVAKLQMTYEGIKKKILEEQGKVRYGFLYEVSSGKQDYDADLEFLKSKLNIRPVNGG